MECLGGTDDSLLKQTFRLSPRSGGWPGSPSLGETFCAARRQLQRARLARRDQRSQLTPWSVGRLTQPPLVDQGDDLVLIAELVGIDRAVMTA